MKAVCWEGTNDIRVERVPDPSILNPRDAIVRVTSTAICGSDLHLLDGFIPTMKPGDILGHEFMGEVVEVGRGVQQPAEGRPRRRAVSDRLRQLLLLHARALVLLRQLQPERARSRENAVRLSPPAGLFGYSHMIGGYAGGQARVRPRAVTPTSARSRCPTHLTRRTGAVPDRHLSHRLHGGGELQHPAGRHRRGLGLRAGRAVRHPQRLPARRRRG